MVDPVTLLTVMAYAVTRNSGTDPKTNFGLAFEALSEMFGGAAGNSFFGDVQKLRQTFLTITKPDSNRDLDRAVARSALQASLFCIMEAIGEPMKSPVGKVALWRQCIAARLPQNLRDLRRPSEGFFADAGRAQLLAAKQLCEKRLSRIEKKFAPVAIDPNRLLKSVEDDYAQRRSSEALAAIEKTHGELSPRARDIFIRKWFGYLCGSFHYEIKHNQPVANILLSISMAELREEVRVGFSKTQTIVVEEHEKTRKVIREGLRPPPTPTDLFATVPPLAHFIERPGISEPLMEKLLSDGGAVGLTALNGMGGVGKTMMALGLCHDPKMRQAFPDGIVWLKIGKESKPSFEEQVKKVAQALNQEFRVYSEAAYQSLFKDKAALVVLDDVWRLGDIEPFLLHPGRSRLLYTSRDVSLAGPLHASSQEVGVLDEAQARRFLGRWSDRENGLPEPHASGILSECRGLALGISMIGAALKGKPDEDWADILTDLKRGRLRDVGTRPGGYAYETLHAAIAVSVDALDAVNKDRYLRLAVLLEDMPAATPVLQALWGGDEREARRSASIFADRSLARRDPEGILLHDFQLDYVRGEHPQPEALALQHAALRRSAHVVRPHPEQFASQMTGRLLGHVDKPGIRTFLEELRVNAPRPWLRPLRPALDAADGPVERILEGHTNNVEAVAVTADGKRAVSGSDDTTVMIWDLEGHQPPRCLEGHWTGVKAVAVTPNGSRAVSGSFDGTVIVWDLEGDLPPRLLEGHSESVNTVAVTADGKRAVSGSYDNTLRVWDLEGDRPSRVLKGHTGIFPTAVAVTADGKQAVSASYESNLVMVWDLDTDHPPRVLEGHQSQVEAVAVTADGKHAVSGSYVGTLIIWDLEGNQRPRSLEGRKVDVDVVAVTADGKRAVSSSYGSLIIWDLVGHQPPRVVEGHHGVTAFGLSGDGKRAVSCSFASPTLTVWNLEAKSAIAECHKNRVNAVALSADGKRGVSGSEDGTLMVWDLESHQSPRVLERHHNPVSSVAITADGSRAISGSRAEFTVVEHPPLVWGPDDKTLIVWDLEGDQPPRALEGHRHWVLDVAMTGDGKYAVSKSDDGTLMGWELEGEHPPRVLKGASRPQLVKGKRMVSDASEYTLLLRELEGNQDPTVLRVLECYKESRVSALAVTADGKRAVVSGFDDDTFTVWDLQRAERLAIFNCDAKVHACAFAGGYIVAGDSRGNVHLLAYEE